MQFWITLTFALLWGKLLSPVPCAPESISQMQPTRQQLGKLLTKKFMTFDWLHNIYKIEDESLPNADAVIALQKLQLHSHIVHTNTHTVHTQTHL